MVKQTEAIWRREEAIRVRGILRSRREVLGLMIVGSCAYNPYKVRRDSDLDLVAVTDFRDTYFKDIAEKVGATHHNISARYTRRGTNVFSLVYTVKPDDPDIKFEVGLHFWDKSAWENVIRLDGTNRIFGDESTEHFRSTAPTEVMWNARGSSIEVPKPCEEVEEGVILDFYPCYKSSGEFGTERDFYTGIQANNLLMYPQILVDRKGTIKRGLERFKRNLRKRMREVYGPDHGLGVSLLNCIPPELREKLTKRQREELEAFF